MEQVVLILGAGASNALHSGFGLGSQLIQDISDRVTDRNTPNDLFLSALLEQQGFPLELRKKFQHDLDNYRARVPYASIDGFMDEVGIFPEYREYREEYNQISKFLIVAHILGYEANLINNFDAVNNWVDVIASFLMANNILTHSRKCNLRIITFNYDRSLEHLLYTNDKMRGYAENVKHFIQENVLHVYGKIGPLEWQGEPDYFEIGEENNQGRKIFQRKNAINLMYGERWNNSHQKELIANWLHNSSTTHVGVFGFNFDLINYRRLSLQNLGTVNPKCKLIANIYPGPINDFERRRSFGNHVREIKHDVHLTCLNSNEYFSFLFSD